MLTKILNNPAFLLLAFILIAVAIITFWFPHANTPLPTAKVADQLKCNSTKISPRLNQMAIGESGAIKLIVSLRQKPDEATVNKYQRLGVMMQPETWIFDYLVAEADYRVLCRLAAEDDVTYIDAWQS